MAYIYKITNIINNKIYIGKTEGTIEDRWKQHIRDSKKSQIQHRPLYSAIQKYGINNFKIEIVEQCDNTIINDREKYWIEYYNSYKNGYNATIGGDGTVYCDYDLVYSLYQEGLTMTQISNMLSYDISTCRRILNTYNVTKEERIARGVHSLEIPVIQLDKDTQEIINIFPSAAKAAKFLGKERSGHIASVCKGKRQTAYGYKWKYGSTLKQEENTNGK